MINALQQRMLKYTSAAKNPNTDKLADDPEYSEWLDKQDAALREDPDAELDRMFEHYLKSHRSKAADSAQDPELGLDLLFEGREEEGKGRPRKVTFLFPALPQYNYPATRTTVGPTEATAMLDAMNAQTKDGGGAESILKQDTSESSLHITAKNGQEYFNILNKLNEHLFNGSIPAPSLAPGDEQAVQQSVSDLQKVSTMLEKFIEGFATIEKRLRQIKESTLPTQWQQNFGKNHPYQTLLRLRQTVDEMVDFLGDFTKQEKGAASSLPSKSSDQYYVPGQLGADGLYRPGGMTSQGFNFYQQKAKDMSDEALSFAIKDLHKTIELQEQGVREGTFYPKLGFYWDEYWIYLNEKNARNKKKAKIEPEEPSLKDLDPDQVSTPQNTTPSVQEPLPALTPQSGIPVKSSPVNLVREYLENEDANCHTENLVLLAQVSKDPKLLNEATSLVEAHQKRGFIDEPLRAWQRVLETALNKNTKVQEFNKQVSSQRASSAIPADSLSSAVPHLRISYAVWKPEDIEAGEASEIGWEDEDGIAVELDADEEARGMTLVDKTVEILQDAGAVYPAEGAKHPWYSTELETDDPRHRRATTVFSYFLVGYSPEQEREVLAQIKHS